MSSQTPNINLTLPAGSEKVSRQIINDNNTKIDTAIGSLSDSIATGISRQYGADINIIGYNSSSNSFTAPRDGYIYVQVWNTDSTLNLWMIPNRISIELSTNRKQFAIYVARGSGWYITGSGSNRSAYFVPLIS